MRIIIHWFLRALAVMVTAYLLPGVLVKSFFTALVVAIVLAFLNTFLRPLLILISLPLEILTLGLFTVIINAALVLLASRIVDGFALGGIWTALWFSVILSLVNAVLHLFESDKKKEA